MFKRLLLSDLNTLFKDIWSFECISVLLKSVYFLFSELFLELSKLKLFNSEFFFFPSTITYLTEFMDYPVAWLLFEFLMFKNLIYLILVPMLSFKLWLALCV